MGTAIASLWFFKTVLVATKKKKKDAETIEKMQKRATKIIRRLKAKTYSMKNGCKNWVRLV